MEYLHTMVRITDIEESLDFFCNKMGMVETRRIENEKGRFTLIFLAANDDMPEASDKKAPLLELTYNWDPEEYSGGRNFGIYPSRGGRLIVMPLSIKPWHVL